MNTWRLFRADLHKQKWGVLWLLVLVLPLGANLAMVFDMALRYSSYLFPRGLQRGFSSWQMLLIEHHHVLMWGTFLPLFVALISALVYAPEFQHQGWKQLLTLPIRKLEVYFAKDLAIVFFTFWLIALDTAGLMLVGTFFRFPEPLPLALFAQSAGMQFAAALAVAALHSWLSSYHRNALTPVAVGFFGSITAYTLFYSYPELAWLCFYAYPLIAGDVRGAVPGYAALGGVLLALLFFTFGWFEFRRRDIF